MDPLLTEGARRALDRAARLAREGGAAAVAPAHVLWALALEESRGSEMLAAHGITPERLRSESPLPGDAPHGAPDEHAGEPKPGETPAPHSRLVREILVSARRIAAEAGRQVEIGTEFLLFGLADVESDVALLLQRFGLDAARARGKAVEVAGHDNRQLAIDFSLSLRDRTEDERIDSLRILDAAANRAREGLRVVEDYLRFALDDPHLSGFAKTCRHDLAAALAPLAAHGLVAARDTLRDVGTAIHTASEQRRESPLDVLQANLKRAQEALRTLEEFGKVISTEAAEACGQLRYRLYTLEKAALTTVASREDLAGRNLCLLATDAACHHGIGPAVRGAVANGVGIVQVREKSMPDRKLLEHARRVRQWTREAGALCIMNDRPDLAVAAGADGVHVGQDELPVREARRIVGPRRLVGVSTHSIEQARQAVLDGADYLGVGPVFPSGTKQFEQLAGLDFVRQVAEEIALPWFAIGGITAENVPRVVAAGARRIAVCASICGAEDPAEAAAKLATMLASAPVPRRGKGLEGTS